MTKAQVVAALDEETGEIVGVENVTRCELDAGAIVALRWLWVQDKLPAIPKGALNKDQNFKYRSIDQVLSIVHRLFGLAGVFVLPARQQALYTEWQGRNSMIHVTRLTCDWQIWGANGDWITAQTIGQGADSFDKGTQKAQTASFKYLLWPSLSIAENEWDPDAHTPEETTLTTRGTRQGVDAGAAALVERVENFKPQTFEGPEKATPGQLSYIRGLAKDNNIAVGGTEMTALVRLYGEPGMPRDIIDLEKWQAKRLIDDLKAGTL
jgi:hypothetical protein